MKKKQKNIKQVSLFIIKKKNKKNKKITINLMGPNWAIKFILINFFLFFFSGSFCLWFWFFIFLSFGIFISKN